MNDWPGMVLTNRLLNKDMKTLEPCNYTDADTHVYFCTSPMQHIRVTKKLLYEQLTVTLLSLFEKVRLAELWIGFGSGKIYRDIFVQTPHQQIGPSKSLALPLFHSLTGCGTASHSLSCGMKSGWNAWQNTPDINIDCPY